MPNSVRTCALVLHRIDSAGKAPIDERPTLVSIGANEDGNPAEQTSSVEFARLIRNFETIDERPPDHPAGFLRKLLKPTAERCERQGRKHLISRFRSHAGEHTGSIGAPEGGRERLALSFSLGRRIQLRGRQNRFA